MHWVLHLNLILTDLNVKVLGFFTMNRSYQRCSSQPLSWLVLRKSKITAGKNGNNIINLGMHKTKHITTALTKCKLSNKKYREAIYNPGLVTSYDIWPANRAELFAKEKI